ncbi:MAG: tRNA (adenosine(37)-N6)-threonylcarbamoyltransferase complex ATPase subunit type 1 TsaE [Oscillospiraceae bacterium]|jgi:tRNA threonylcarbamoyladenosine biosynthesis protein TsaE|nr:tRNA (adenosine(37)-N6)-threonylcarbamoyltransferase complex ATPase subunit type 1 TsaE [Oscillospiraceae bacterium]
MKYIYKTQSESESRQLGFILGSALRGAECIAMFGDLGAGKTTFIRGLAKGLSIDESEISSPTFALVHEHEGRCRLFHFDMYRVVSLEDLYSTGFFDYLENGVMVIEWSENIENALPENHLSVRIEKDGENGRIFEIDGVDTPLDFEGGAEN